jgi:hypothetical protein
MSMLAKALGAVFGAIGAVYSSIAIYTVVSANGEVSQYSQQEKKAQKSLLTWQSSLQKHEQAAATAEAESKAEETVRHPFAAILLQQSSSNCSRSCRIDK